MKKNVKEVLDKVEKVRTVIDTDPDLYPVAFNEMDKLVWDEIIDNFEPDKLAFTDITEGGIIKLYLNEKLPKDYLNYLRLHEFGHILFGHTKANVEELHYEQLKRKCYQNWDTIAQHIEFDKADEKLTKIELANKYIVPLSELFLSYAEDFEVNSKLFSKDEWLVNIDMMDYADIITTLKSFPSAVDMAKLPEFAQKNYDKTLDDIKDWLDTKVAERRHWCHPLWPEDYDMPTQLSCPEYIDLIFSHLEKFMNFIRKEVEDQKKQQPNTQPQQNQNGQQQPQNSQSQSGQQGQQQNQQQQGQGQQQQAQGQNANQQQGSGQQGNSTPQNSNQQQGNGQGQGTPQQNLPWQNNGQQGQNDEETSYEKPTESGGGKGNTGTGKRPSLLEKKKKQQQQQQGAGQGKGQPSPMSKLINDQLRKLSLKDIEELRKQANRDDTNKEANKTAASGSHNKATGGNNEAVGSDGGGEWTGTDGLGFGHTEKRRPDVLPLGDGKELARYIERESFSKKIENAHSNIMYYYNRRKYGTVDVVTKETKENVYRPGNIYVVVDCSGSIDERAIKKMLNVIKQLSKKCGPKSRVIWWDTRLCKDVLLREQQEPICGGGTDIAEGIRYVREKYLKNSNDKLFIISDYYDSLKKWLEEANKIRNEITGICWTQDKSIKSVQEFIRSCNYGSDFQAQEFLNKIPTKIVIVD